MSQGRKVVMGRHRQLEIRNPKSKIRNKSEIQNTKPMPRRELVSDFEFRVLLSFAMGGLLFALLATPVAAFHHTEKNGPATLEARSDHDRPTLALADVLHVVISLEGEKGLHIDTAVRLVPGASWELLSSSAPEPKMQETGRMRWQQTLTLAPLAPGEQKLELTSLVFHDVDADPRTIAWKSFTVLVSTQIKDADPTQIRDITATEDPPAAPERTMPVWLWFALPPPVVLLGLAGLWLLRRRAQVRPMSASARAKRECARLLAMRLPEKGHGKSFVTLLTGIVRRYLERRYDLPARRQTTAELLRDIDARTDLDADAKRWLHSFFEQADRVKFAGTPINAEHCAAAAAEVRHFCESTAMAE
jgi:hypothetical protein